MRSRHWFWPARWAVFWVAALGPFVFFPGVFAPLEWQGAFLLLLFAWWPLQWLAARPSSTSLDDPLWQGPAAIPVLLMAASLAVSLAASPNREWAWESAGYLAWGIALFSATVIWPPLRRRPQRLAWALVAAGVGLALLAPVFLANKPWPVPGGAAQAALQGMQARLGETVNENVLAAALALLLPLALALALRGGRRADTFAAWAATGLMAAALALANSRGAWAGAAAGCALVAVLLRKELRWVGAVSGLAVAAGLVWLGPRALGEYLAARDAIGGLPARIEIWTRAVYIVEDFPLTGIGPGAFAEVVTRLYPYFVVPPNVQAPHAHNLPLQAAVELGLPGLAAFIALNMVVAALSVRVLGRCPGPHAGMPRALAAGTLGAVTALWLHGMVDAALWGSKPAFLVWLVYSLAVLVGLRSAPVAFATRNEETIIRNLELEFAGSPGDPPGGSLDGSKEIEHDRAAV